MKRWPVLLVVAFFVSSICPTETLGQAAPMAQNLKSPALAGFSSLIFPGFGQFYNGRHEDVVKGIVMSSFFVGSIAGFVLLSDSSTSTNSNGQGNAGSAGLGIAVLLYPLVLIQVVDHTLSAIDAVASADAINRDLQKRAQMDFNFGPCLLSRNDHYLPSAEMVLRF